MNHRMKTHQQGISILELLIVLTIIGILSIVAINAFTQSRAIHTDMQRKATSHDDLSFINEKIGQALTTLPGREMGAYSGVNYSIATKLPACGVVLSGAVNKPVQLGFVTPYRINGQDAIVVLTTPADSLRMELAQSSQASPTGGSAYVIQPGLRAGKQLPISNLPGKDSLLMVIGSAPLPQIGARPPLPSKLNPNIVAETRLIKLTKAPSIQQIGTGLMAQKAFLLDYTFSVDGTGTAFPHLINNSDSNLKTFGVGATILPVNLVTFYWSNNHIVRNEGGEVIYDQTINDFTVIGGTETILGSADSLTITYKRSDQIAEEPTPKSPLQATSWLNQIVGITVKLTRLVAPSIGNKNISTESKISYPIAMQTID